MSSQRPLSSALCALLSLLALVALTSSCTFSFSNRPPINEIGGYPIPVVDAFVEEAVVAAFFEGSADRLEPFLPDRSAEVEDIEKFIDEQTADRYGLLLEPNAPIIDRRILLNAEVPGYSEKLDMVQYRLRGTFAQGDREIVATIAVRHGSLRVIELGLPFEQDDTN